LRGWAKSYRRTGPVQNTEITYAISALGHTPEEIRDVIHAEIERIRNQDIGDDEL